MAETKGDTPLSYVLLDGDRRKITHLTHDQLRAIEALQRMVDMAGVDGDGRPRLAVTAGLIDDHLALVTSIKGRRAELVAETVRYESWQPGLDGQEWNPRHALYGPPPPHQSNNQQEVGPRGLD